jgi:hypothetical protein
VCFNGTKCSKNDSEVENVKIMGENKADCIMYAKGIIHHQSLPKKNRLQAVNL